MAAGATTSSTTVPARKILRGERGADHLNDNFLGISEDNLRDYFVLEVNLGMDTIEGFTQSTGNAGDVFWLQEGQFNIAHNSQWQPHGRANPQHHELPRPHRIAAPDLRYRPTRFSTTTPTGSGANASSIAIAKIGNIASIAISDFTGAPGPVRVSRRRRRSALGPSAIDDGSDWRPQRLARPDDQTRRAALVSRNPFRHCKSPGQGRPSRLLSRPGDGARPCASVFLPPRSAERGPLSALGHRPAGRRTTSGVNGFTEFAV